MCRKPCTTDALVTFQAKKPAAAPKPDDKEALRLSTKLKALVKEVQGMMAEDEDSKCIVFSQFTSMLDLVEV